MTDLYEIILTGKLVGNGGGGGGADFETGTIIGDGLDTNTRTIPTTKKWSNFAILCYGLGTLTHANNDYLAGYGNATEYTGVAFSNNTASAVATVADTRGVYLKFFDDKIKLMPVANGAFKKLIEGAEYKWIAW